MSSSAGRWGAITFPALYYIHTFSALTPADRTALYRTCTDVIQGGCRLIQLRYKGEWSEEIAGSLQMFLADFEGSDTKFIMNDQVKWAREAGTHGLHVGDQGDTEPAAARRIMAKEALLGATTKTASQLHRALAAEVDYVSYGALYASTTKPDAVPGALERIPEYVAQLPQGVKFCVIGGITLETIPTVMRQTGIDIVAVGAAIQQAEDVELATLKFVDALRLAISPA